MNGTLRIAQVSDCHVSAAPGTPYRGQDPVHNLQTVLDRVAAEKPDMLLATGDLSEDGSAESYAVLAGMLARPGVPVLALPGNHDEPELLAGYFPGSPVNGIEVTDHSTWQIIRIDSCVPGQPHGKIGGRVWAALKEALAQGTGRPRLVALHHQPLPAGSPWIDKYRLMDAEPFLELVTVNPDVKAVAWGHIHQPFEAEINGTLMLGSPSSASNSLPGTETFTFDDKGPAYRWLELAPDGTISSEITSVGARNRPRIE